jgi:eukaryotic-like serine/threonine-protein kinase
VRQLSNSFLFEFHDAIENLPGATPARELVVHRAIDYLDKLAAESENNPSLERELGTAYAKIGLIQGNSYHSNLGDTDGAMRSYQRSLEIRQKVAAADPNDHEIQHELADSYEGVGDIQYTISDLKGGLESYEKAVAIREKIVAEEPGNLEYLYSFANILGKRGDISGMEGFPNLGDLPKALESYNRGIALYEKLIAAAPNNEKYKSGYATMLHYAGMLKSVTGDAKGAIANGRKSVSIFESMLAAQPNSAKYETHLMSALVFLRFPLLNDGQTAEAVKNAERVVRTMEKQVAEDPKNAFARRSLSVSYNSLGICLLQDGNVSKAIENHRKSLAIVEELFAADPENVENRRDKALTIEFLAEAQLRSGDYDAALANYRRIFPMYEGDSSAENKADTPATLYIGIAKVLAAKRELKEAAENIRRAVAPAESAANDAPANVKLKHRLAEAYFEAGVILRKYHQISKDEKYDQEACEFFQKSYNVWNALRQNETLNGISADRPDETLKELAACDMK